MCPDLPLGEGVLQREDCLEAMLVNETIPGRQWRDQGMHHGTLKKEEAPSLFFICLFGFFCFVLFLPSHPLVEFH